MDDFCRMGKISISQLSDYGLINKIYRELIQLKRKITNTNQNRQRKSRDFFFPKGDIRMANKYMKRSSVTLVIKEMQIKATMIYHLMPVRMTVYLPTPARKAVKTRQEITNAGVDVEKRGPLCTSSGIITWYSYYEKQYGGISKNENHKHHMTQQLHF